MSRYKGTRVSVDHPVARINATLRTHPDGSQTVGVWEHRVVMWDKIGAGPHLCHWCGKGVVWNHADKRRQLVVDHVDTNPRNNDPANLVPSCNGCNNHRHLVIQPGELFIVAPNGKRRRAVERTCLTCGETFLIAPASLRKDGAGRYCSMQCVYRRVRE